MFTLQRIREQPATVSDVPSPIFARYDKENDELIVFFGEQHLSHTKKSFQNLDILINGENILGFVLKDFTKSLINEISIDLYSVGLGDSKSFQQNLIEQRKLDFIKEDIFFNSDFREQLTY
jgi:hypothetical protein